MKNALNTVVLLTAFVFLTAFQTDEGLPKVTDETNKIEILFTRSMQTNDLVQIKKSLAVKGIAIMYNSFDFDENGGLKSLSFTVDCNDGFKGGAQNTNIGNRTKWGFYRDYAEDTESPFETGF